MSPEEKPGMSFEDVTRDDVEAERRILEVVRRCYKDAKEGRTKLIPGEEAFAELRAEID